MRKPCIAHEFQHRPGPERVENRTHGIKLADQQMANLRGVLDER